jgi:hypothetical protein
MTTHPSSPLTDEDLQAIDDLTTLATALHEHGYSPSLDTTTSPPRLALTQPGPCTGPTEYLYAKDSFYCWDVGTHGPAHNLPRHVPFCDTQPGGITYAAKAVTLLMHLAALHDPDPGTP